MVEIFNKDLTFIIQGKLVDRELLQRNINNLSRYGKVIIAVWGMTSELKEEEIRRFVVENRINNEQNVYLQVYTTLWGLQRVDTDFVIKVRSDEYYHDFGPFISEMKSNTHKIITTNIFFRRTKNYPYHISDHVIGGLKENVLKMFGNCKRLLESKRRISRITRCIPEQWLTISYLLSFYGEDSLIKGSMEEINEKMKSHFSIVNVERLKNFVIVYTDKKSKKQITKVEELNKVVDIGSIEEL